MPLPTPNSQLPYCTAFQVRFGVLNAGLYGVPQSRKRTFIWAALPGEDLPEWPVPRHVFVSRQLGVRVSATWRPYDIADVPSYDGDDGEHGTRTATWYYNAVPPLPGAPLRSVTVRDAIYDLPPVDNDATE